MKTMLLLALGALSACAAPPATEALSLLPGLPVTIADMEAEAPLTGGEVRVPKPAQPKVPASDVRGRRDGDELTLRWHEAWYAAVRLDSPKPLDLRGWLAEGTLEFDVRAGDLSRSGFSLKASCGKDCERRVNHVLASRALSGRGWQHLAVPLRCFEREGADFSAIQRPFVLESSGSGELALRQVRLVPRGTANVPCPDWRTESVTPSPLEEVWSLDWWMPRHQKKLAEIRAHPGTRLVFIGDSITHGWEEAGAPVWQRHFARHGALNLGFGGDRTENVLWRLQHGELDGLQPKLVVLMIGTNNTGHRLEDPATTVAGIRRLLDEIGRRQPQARVLLLGLFPRDPQPGTPMRRLNERINALLPGLADGRRIVFLDIGAQLANADGTLAPEIFPDWLHLSEAGYERWARAIGPTVERLLAEP